MKQGVREAQERKYYREKVVSNVSSGNMKATCRRPC